MTNRDTLERLNAEPVVNLADFKAHQVIEHFLDDALCTSYLLAASEYAEIATERIYMLARYKLSLDVWPAITAGTGRRRLNLPGSPIRAIENVTYVDSIGVKQSLPVAALEGALTRDGAALVFSESLPELYSDCPALPQIEIVYVVGFGSYTPPTLPAGFPLEISTGTHMETAPLNIQQAVKLIAGWWYEQRETAVVGTIASEIPVGAEALLQQRKILGV